MSTASSRTAEATGADPLEADHNRRPRRRHRWVVTAVVLVVAVAGVLVGVSNPFAKRSSTGVGVADNADPTSLYTVSRQDLSSETQLDATLGYAGAYSVVNQAQGTITSLPNLGQVISNGQVLYDVNGAPVVLLTGSTPAYRTLAEGATAQDVSGPDVQELNDDLVTLGYITSTELGASTSDFTYWTKVGIEDLQAHLGVTVNGTLALGQVVFLPTAARVTALGTSTVLGGPAQPGALILSATSTTRQVTLELDTTQQSEVAVGDQVTITLPDNQTTPGTISSVGTVASVLSSGASPTITVVVTPTDPTATGAVDQAPVEVSITTASVKDALVVPVDALLALASGGYGVEVVSSTGVHSIVPVALGLFDDSDGMVQITGSSLSTGQRVVVPAL